MTNNPLIIRNSSVLKVQRCLVAWSLKNVREPNNKIEVTTSSGKSDLVIPQGYYNFSSLQDLLKQNNITIKKLADNRVSLTSTNAVNLKDFGPLLGFEENQSISANTLTVSKYSASLTNKLKNISVSSEIVDSGRVYSQVANTDLCYSSNRIFDLSIDTTQSLNGDFTEYNLNSIETPCRSFHSQEFKIFVGSGGHEYDYEIYLTVSIS